MKNNFIKGFSVFLLYEFIGEFVLLLVLSILDIHYKNLNLSSKMLVTLIYESILLIIISKIYQKDIQDNFKDYKKNIKTYLKTYLKYWLIVIITMMISNTIIYNITHIYTSTNQKNVLSAIKNAPIYSIMLTVLISPILEELVFRLSFRKMIKNDTLFIILSGFIFGALHLTSATSIPELLYIVPYAIPGCIFAYTLVKSKNIFVPISLHFIHNTILIIFQLILLFI